jgi:hypothetical protein
VAGMGAGHNSSERVKNGPKLPALIPVGTRAFHEPQNVYVDFQRLVRSHPSPLIPLPVEGRGSRDRQSQLFGRRPT